MPDIQIDITTDAFSFQQVFGEHFATPLAEMTEILFARASHEIETGFPHSACQTALQAVELSRWSNNPCRPYACGLAAQLLLDNGQVADARMICLQGMEIANPDVLSDLSRLLDIISGESWKE
ncbi:MAG TPA: hypothetical protein ENH10_10895 [Bacteroidetes bacterium]|nr:hypothetical protein BMS3Bbin04_01580 [bacterium BMS3Bbin04]HDO66515.1 hypothetical protein [Bacteroidota bacterium]HEX05640.1 hypothetical protein [Bacteroidota bacterium]